MKQNLLLLLIATLFATNIIAQNANTEQPQNNRKFVDYTGVVYSVGGHAMVSWWEEFYGADIRIGYKFTNPITLGIGIAPGVTDFNASDEDISEPQDYKKYTGFEIPIYVFSRFDILHDMKATPFITVCGGFRIADNKYARQTPELHGSIGCRVAIGDIALSPYAIISFIDAGAGFTIDF